MGWSEKGGLETAEKELLRSIGKTHRLATSRAMGMAQDLNSPVRPLLLDSEDDSSGKENQKCQTSTVNARDYRERILTESSDDDFDQFLMQRETPKANLLKPQSAAKKVSVPVVVVSSDSEGSFETFLNRVKTPKTKSKSTAGSGSEDSLRKFIVEDFSSDDDFMVEKKKPATCKVKKTPKTLIAQPSSRKPLSQFDSPVFLGDSDDDNGVTVKSSWRTRHPPRQPSSCTTRVRVLERDSEDISPPPSPPSSPLPPSFLFVSPSCPFIPSSAPSLLIHSTHSKIEDSASSDEEFLSLLDRLKKNQKTSSSTTTPKHSTGSNRKPPDSVPTIKFPVLAPPTKGQNVAGPRPVGTTPLEIKTPVRLPVILPPVSQTEPRQKSSRLGMCKTPGCFLESLSSYTCSFKHTKEDLTSKLYQLYNTSVFDCKLPASMSVSWNKKMRKTAGYCVTGQERGGGSRYARIELSDKVCDSADRLRDTLVHEMCHAATWLINGVRDGHGPFWKLYARKATLAHPELPMVTRCHSYDINYKYQYQCSRCENTIGRHSKSLDIQRFVCALCTGPLVLLVPANSKPRAPTPFARFVKENYGSVRQEMTGQSHANVMRKLSADFATKTRLSQT